MVKKLTSAIFLIILMVSCNLFETPLRENEYDENGDNYVGNDSFTEEHISLTSSTDTEHGYMTSYNRGLGQAIKLNSDYKPLSFSVWIDPGNAYKDGGGSGSAIALTLQLRIWNASGGMEDGDLLGSASAAVSAGQEGEVVFPISFSGDPIPADTRILYAVYVPGGLTDQIRARLEIDGTNGYGDTSETTLMRTSNSLDNEVDVFSEWSTLSTNDLKFSLTVLTY